MSSKKIAFVCDAVYPYNKGGKETRLFEISTRLAKRGYDVHIYCMQWWKGKADRVENGVHLHGICPYIPLYDGPRRSIKQGLMFGLSCLKLLRESFDVIEVDHMPFFPLYFVRIVCWLKGKKMFATWHEVWGPTYWKSYLHGFKGLIASLIERISVQLPDKIFAVSQLTAHRLHKQLQYSGPLEIIPNGVDIQFIKSVKKSKITSDIIFAGRLLSHKNVDVLIEAIHLVKGKKKNIKAIIVGDGPEKPEIEELINKLQLQQNISLYPFKEQIDELYSLIKSSKVFVLPSTREGFGLVVIEANACGIPVITVDHPDTAAKDLITNHNGRVVELSKSALAKEIEFYLDEKTHHFQHTHVEEYSWDSIVNALTKLY